MKTAHLVCNAHLDPVWQWGWAEGAGEAMGTFRTAADFCEEFDGYVFNHNESILYQYVEEYDLPLFRRIQRLVKAGKWHIAGGWYLQPDCNMPSGESLVRQILEGKRYFREKFGVEPTTAYNFDSFGHSRGLPQILAKSGYDSYIHCRPGGTEMVEPMPARTYRWVGYDGSSVAVQHAYAWYCSSLGTAGQRVEDVLKVSEKDGLPAVLVLWGVGDHGGGASRRDLQLIEKVRRQHQDVNIVHSTPEAFFRDIRRCRLPEVRHELQRCFPGCYTSQALVKTGHRQLENLYFIAERMAAHAWAAGLGLYPVDELATARRALLFCEFHDILCGTCTQDVEDMVLRRLAEGVSAAERVQARSFFALGVGQKKGKPGTFPMLAFNPHPFPVRGVFDGETSFVDIEWGKGYWTPTVTCEGMPVAHQAERQQGNVNIEWRKKVAVAAELAPSGMTRFDITFRRIKAQPKPALKPGRTGLVFRNDQFRLSLDPRTGLIDALRMDGRSLLAPGGFRLLCLEDNDDPWGTAQNKIRKVRGAFKLVSTRRARELNAVPDSAIGPVTVIEDGAVRSVVQAIFEYGSSHAVVRYAVPKAGPWFDVDVTLYHFEKRCMIKLAAPLAFSADAAWCQSAYGRESRALDGTEQVGQQWVAAVPAAKTQPGVAFLNAGTYGFDATASEVRLNLLRSSAYAFLPIRSNDAPVRDRFHARIDQGERRFRFRVLVGPSGRLLETVDREAQVFNQPPMLMALYPAGGRGARPPKLVEIDDSRVLVAAVKQAERGQGLVVRLFEPTGRPRIVTLRVMGRALHPIRLSRFEVKTLVVNVRTGKTRETDLLER